MTFRHLFEFPKYQDSPLLSDQLLLPNISQGFNLFIISSYVPSYVISLLRDIATSPEMEPGKISLTLYLPGDTVSEQQAIARLHRHLLTSFRSSSDLNEFIQDALQISQEGGLFIQVLHGPVSRTLIKGTIGVIVEELTDEYVSFEDKKPGDFNSPVAPKRSWVAEEISDAESIARRINNALQGSLRAATLIEADQLVRWLVAISEAISNSMLSSHADASGDKQAKDRNLFTNAQIDEDLDWEVEFEEIYDYDIVETTAAETFGLVDSEDDPMQGYFFSGYSIPVTEHDLDVHHVPPVAPQLVGIIGQASAICFCGKKFNRVSGCPAIVW